MKLKLPEISADKFTWIKNIGTSFFTDLNLNTSHLFDRVYDDAADLGMVVVSPRTNKKVTFVLTQLPDGDKNNEYKFESIDIKPELYIRILNT